MTLLIKELNENLKKAVAHFWKTGLKQLERQQASDRKDQGARSAVTEPASDLSFELFARSLVAHVGAYAK